MRFSALDRYTFDCRGWVAFDHVLDGAALTSLRASVEGRALPPAGDSIGSQRFGQDGELFRWHRSFRDLIDHRLVLAALAALVGPRPRLDHAYGIRMAPGTSGLGLHGPEQPFDPSQFYVHRGGRMWNGMVAFSWALVDGRPGDGGFGCVSGSHRAEERVPAGADGLVEEVPQRAGSLLVFSEALFHRTLPWRGSGERLCLLYKYCPGNSAWGADPPVPADVVAQLTPRQRLLVEPPYVAGRPSV